MILLTIGVLLWAFAHLIKSILPGLRAALVGKLGENPYKGLVALDIVIAIVLMVFGWRSAAIDIWYVPPLAGSPYVTAALVLIAFVLMGAANAPTNIKRFLRHPMLTGVVVWAIAHLLANGDNRSVVLFGGLGVWAALEIVLVSRRDGEWIKPEPVPVAKDVTLIVVGSVLFALVAYFHEFLFGVAPIPAL